MVGEVKADEARPMLDVVRDGQVQTEYGPHDPHGMTSHTHTIEMNMTSQRVYGR
jgi:hypothetical protein